MNAKRIIELFKRVSLKHVKTPLGRWNIHNYKETTLKIKYANEDNCGVCCNENKESDDLYMYSMGYGGTKAWGTKALGTKALDPTLL